MQSVVFKGVNSKASQGVIRGLFLRYGEQLISEDEFSFFCLFFFPSDICVSRLQDFLAQECCVRSFE